MQQPCDACVKMPCHLVSGAVGAHSHAVVHMLQKGQEPDVWLQLLERCAAEDPTCQPTALRSLAQQLAEQRVLYARQLAEQRALTAQQQQQLAAQHQLITAQQQQLVIQQQQLSSQQEVMTEQGAQFAAQQGQLQGMQAQLQELLQRQQQ